MQNSRQVKQRIKTAKNIAKITKAMEMVSASKMRRAQDQALATRPYNKALRKSLRELAEATDISTHPLLTAHDQGVDACVVLATDKGLCGSLNSNLFKLALEWSDAHPEGVFIVIGRKGVALSRISGLHVHAQFIDLPAKVSVSAIAALNTLVLDGFLDKTFKTVHLIYTDFISTLVNKPRIEQILPLPGLTEEEKTLVDSDTSEYVFEPSPESILDKILPFYLENSLFQALLESKASEHSARMVSMKNASDNAKELMGELKLEYNKSRQAGITAELLDITTAMLSQS